MSDTMPSSKAIRLKGRTETVIKVDYNDLDDFIHQTTGRDDYSCCDSQEWNNDSQHRFHVENKPLSEYDQKEWSQFKLGNKRHCYLGILLDGLCVDGLIPPGNYIINVRW
jgi:hypothetical protein